MWPWGCRQGVVWSMGRGDDACTGLGAAGEGDRKGKDRWTHWLGDMMLVLCTEG